MSVNQVIIKFTKRSENKQSMTITFSGGETHNILWRTGGRPLKASLSPTTLFSPSDFYSDQYSNHVLFVMMDNDFDLDQFFN